MWIAEIWRYPAKSMAGERLVSAWTTGACAPTLSSAGWMASRSTGVLSGGRISVGDPVKLLDEDR